MANQITELEGCVLGLVWEKGPSTPYAIRRVFQESPSSHWSGSAGAIYPLVRRLESSGLLRSREDFTGQRRRELYEITAQGLRTLRSWVGPGGEDWSVTIPVDPLRLRVRFLGALPPAKRAEFLRNAEEQVVTELEDAKKGCKEHKAEEAPFAYLLARGVAKIARARLSWLKEAEDVVRLASNPGRKNAKRKAQ